jgi:hypothetical protein
MGGRGGGSPGGAGNWRTDVAEHMKPMRHSHPDVLFPDDDTWPRAHLLPNATEQARLEGVLRDVYKDLNVHLEGWVRLPAIRDALAKRGLNRTRQDAAIFGLALKHDARVIKIANLKSLSLDDRRASIYFGGDFHHALRIGYDH